MTVGTDFLTFATGSGANNEDQPSYLADPLRQTGNLPGIARSNFNNKALRQGTFVACAVSTFITQQLDVFVPDDGDVQKYVDYFRQALNALFTGLLPDDPDLSLYVRKSGDTMTGDLQWVPGASLQLSHNTWMRGKNSAGTPLNMMIMGSDNNIYISDGSTAYTIFQNTPLIGNGRFWSCRDNVGVVRPVIGIDGNNCTVINSISNMYINSGNAWFNSSIIIPNGAWYYSKLTNGNAYNIMTVDGANRTLIQSPADMHISTPGDRWIYLNSGNVVISNQLQAPYLRSTGSGQIDGNLIILGALQVNGGSNFYARLNVNYNAGATITGQLDSHTLHSWGNVHADSTLYCWDARAGGSIFVGGLQVFNSGGWFYIVNAVHADQLYSRHDIWCAGNMGCGTINAQYVNSYGNVNANANLTGGGCYAGYIHSYGRVAASSDLWVNGLTFSNSDGYWHTPNGIAIDGLSWLRGACQLHGGFQHFGGEAIIHNGSWYWANHNCIVPYSHGQGACGVNERAWSAIIGFYIGQPSDERDKTDIAPVPAGCLELVRRIVPHAYRMSVEQSPTLSTYDPGPSSNLEGYARSTQIENQEVRQYVENARLSQVAELENISNSLRWGFLSQDVGRVMKDAGVEFGGRMVSPVEGKESLGIMDMVAVLWAAVRELSDEVKSLKAA